MLTKLEKSQIIGTIQSPQWATFERFAEAVIQKLQSENCVSETEWETLNKTIIKEGKVQGIREFFQELIKVTNEPI